jgi:2-keto-3-deoxy-L-rhamnonate aldolase RhmA
MPPSAAQMAATALDLGMVGWVRTPERAYGVIGRLLDAGVTGIIAPRIETADEAPTARRRSSLSPAGTALADRATAAGGTWAIPDIRK